MSARTGRSHTAAHDRAYAAAQAAADAELLTAYRDGQALPDPATMTAQEMASEIATFWATFDIAQVEASAAKLPPAAGVEHMVAAARVSTAYARREAVLREHLQAAERAELDALPPAQIGAALRARAAYHDQPFPTGAPAWPWGYAVDAAEARRWLAVAAAVRRPTAHV